MNKDVGTPSDRESKLLQQVEDLSHDLEEMKSMVMRKNKKTLVAKLKKKFQNCPKIKIGIKKKRKQEKVQKEPKGSQESNVKTSELVTSTTNIDKGSNEEDDPKEKNENIVAKLQKKQDDTEDMKMQQETGVVIEDSQQQESEYVAAEVDSEKHQPEVERRPIDDTQSNENMAKEDTTQSNENTIEGHSENKQAEVDMEISQETGVVIDYSQQQKSEYSEE